MKNNIIMFIFVPLFLIGCLNNNVSIWVSTDIPVELKVQLIEQISKSEFIHYENITYVDEMDKADISIYFGSELNEDTLKIGEWYEAAVVPFFTVMDNVSSKSFDNLNELNNDILIIPFHQLTPEYKVLEIDDNNILDKNCDIENYILRKEIYLSGHNKVLNYVESYGYYYSNRDLSKLNSVVMTGVTALTRIVAGKIEENGITYPARDIRNILLNGDITHLSNEVSFSTNYVLDTDIYLMDFSSSSDYFELFEYVGADVVELTGNHLTDMCVEDFLFTLDLLDKSEIPYFGGGRNIQDASKSVKFEFENNKIAFLGACSVINKNNASLDEPGTWLLDYNKLIEEIKILSEDGYQVIVSIQYKEKNDILPFDSQVQLFRNISDAGAVIVQGSQAHVPQTMEFNDGKFIHFGLGNLFFDQGFLNETREEFIDIHYFYDNRHISTQLVTTYLQDFSRPEPMTIEQRELFLEKVFSFCNY